MARFTTITKEGSMIIINIDEKDTPFKFDCCEGKFYSFTGRNIHSIPSIFRHAKGNNGACILQYAIITYITSGNQDALTRIEKFITHLDKIHVYSYKELPTECPRGYLKWIEQNNLDINGDSLIEFKQEQYTKRMSAIECEIYNLMKQSFIAQSTPMKIFFSLTNLQRNIFCKIFKTSMKTFHWNFRQMVEQFIYTIDYTKKNGLENWENFLDTNRDFDYNDKLLRNIIQEKRNKKILEWETLFTNIETLSDDNFTIIVPKTIEDFAIEGKQQHNCVSYYYHGSIAQHNDIIYFIRKTIKPEKSYITNRFSVCHEKTVETKKINNTINDDTEAQQLIKKIDEKIKEILKTIE